MIDANECLALAEQLREEAKEAEEEAGACRSLNKADRWRRAAAALVDAAEALERAAHEASSVGMEP